MQILMGLVGIVFVLAVAFIFSENRRAIRLRTVFWAFVLQAGFALFVLYVPVGQTVLLGMSGGVQTVIDSAGDGIEFLFGSLAGGNNGFIFAIQVLSVIVFFSSLVSVLYYLGIMRWVINILGGGIQKLMGTSRPESLSAAANIFVGQTEAPLVIRPFIANMTRSELFAVMVGGLASVAGGVLAGYAAMGVDLQYLIAASFMSAPGGLLMAKMMLPETETPRHDTNVSTAENDEKLANVIDAAATGASTGVQLALNVGGMLLAFVSLIALANAILTGIGGLFGFEDLTLQLILGYIFSPVAWLIGVPWSEAVAAGNFIGQKTILNEFVAFASFTGFEGDLSEHTRAIITFALCGFANISSIAILMGGLAVMAPSRRGDVARLGPKAILAGTLSNLMSASLAGLFLSM
ncbi:NupC/NupG family nucleoside CNT transporter [Kushneria indalinina]|uniref:Nucleoside permease n=1 Tax=Kushneria indalinina DSM 14324 TaxID=1122140 RepID=A0A3D9E0I4_9GAMM|nr:NupC/NupG family nucleoside CNT transporter [Kushneria indalinina]REC95984.1 CNT family concentrative nucleoside transporter [Kushneria indalinina DSM 14324]